MNNPRILALVTIVFWAFGGTLGRLLSIKSQFLLQSISYAFTLLTFSLYLMVIYRRNLITQLARRLKVRYLLFGIFGYFVYTASLAQSFRHFDGASETVLLNYTWPLFTVVFTLFIFKRATEHSNEFRFVQTAGILLGFGSVFVLGTRGNLSSLDLGNGPGLLWGLLGGMSYGLFSGFSSTVPKSEHGIFLFGAVFLSLFLMLAFSISEIEVVYQLTWTDVFVAALLGCVLNGVGYITWTRANRLAFELQIDISSIASLMFILPIASLVVVAVVFREDHLSQPYFIFALILILFSSLLCQKTDLVMRLFKRDGSDPLLPRS